MQPTGGKGSVFKSFIQPSIRQLSVNAYISPLNRGISTKTCHKYSSHKWELLKVKVKVNMYLYSAS